MLSLLPDGSYILVPAQHIEEQLHKIVESSPTKAQHPVGVLTSEHRETWYNARERLLTGMHIFLNSLKHCNYDFRSSEQDYSGCDRESTVYVVFRYSLSRNEYQVFCYC